MRKNITKKEITKYRKLTEEALEKIKKSILRGKEEEAKEIINMASDYLSDSKYFEKKGDYVSSFAAINYAHGWIDSGVRLGIFKTKDNRLFTIK